MKNYKCFEEKKIDFKTRFTLLAGDNSSGKTSILEAITIGLGGYLNGIEGIDPRNIYNDEVKMDSQHVGDATVTKDPQYPVKIECWGDFQGNEIQWLREKNSPSGKTTRKNAKQIYNIARSLQDKILKDKDQNVVLPVIAYHSGGRMWSQKREKWTNPFKKEEVSRFLGYTNCLEAGSNIKFFVKWFRRMSTIKLQKGKKIGELDAVLNAITSFMKGLIGKESDISIRFDFEEEEVMVDINDTSVQLRLMSSGYRSLIGMVADTAYRMALLNPQLKEKAVLETPGIVAIDELDSHLHPKWQKRIVSTLKKVFPKVQFIATTHAPIIIATCREDELIYLEHNINNEREHSEFKTDLGTDKYGFLGWSIEEILKYVMGIKQAYSNEFVEIMKKYDEAMNYENYEKAKKAYDVIIKMIHPDNPLKQLLDIQMASLGEDEYD